MMNCNPVFNNPDFVSFSKIYLYVTITSKGRPISAVAKKDANTIPAIPNLLTRVTSNTRFIIATVICLNKVLSHNPAASM